MEIRISELRDVTTKLLDHVEALGVTSVAVDDDYYWKVPTEELHDVTLERLDPTMGQLTDDWKELSAIRGGRADPVAAALVWLSSIYRAVGDRVIG